MCVCPRTAGVAGSPALDRPLLGTPGSCLAPSQCSLIILGIPRCLVRLWPSGGAPVCPPPCPIPPHLGLGALPQALLLPAPLD